MKLLKYPLISAVPSSSVALAAIAALAAASLATAQIAQKGTLRVSDSATLSPHSLPRKGVAPISVSVGWNVSTTDGSMPPKLRRLSIQINRHGRFDFAGLPICKIGRIQPGSSADALAACRSSLVGKGNFKATIALRGQEPYDTSGRLLLFNGPQGGKHVIFGHIYSAHPFATSFVIVFKMTRIVHGTYGTALSAKLPAALSSWGNLTAIQMRLSRHFHFKGHAHSYISAACPAPKGFPGAVFPLARTSFSFADGTKLSSTLTSDCKVRG